MFLLSLRSVRCLVSRCMHTSSSVDPLEIEKFSALASKWWHPNGPFAALHSMNGVRVPLVKQVAANHLHHVGTANSVCVLSGLKILDVGCGGGILSEPLARLGAHVTGVDASATNISVAERHASADDSLSERLCYRCCTAEELVEEQKEGNLDRTFDIVVASEVIEHVSEPQEFVNTCKQLTRPGGALIFTTISRTWVSYATAIVAAESVFGLVPVGTHEWRKFVTPDELTAMLQSGSPASVKSVSGIVYNMLTKRWTRTPYNDINYTVVAVRDDVYSSQPDPQTNPTHAHRQDSV